MNLTDLNQKINETQPLLQKKNIKKLPIPMTYPLIYDVFPVLTLPSDLFLMLESNIDLAKEIVYLIKNKLKF